MRGLLTPKFKMATWLFLKIDMQHRVGWHREEDKNNDKKEGIILLSRYDIGAFQNEKKIATWDIGFTGDVPWAPPLSPSSDHWGDKLHTSTSHNQPKPQYLLSVIKGQSQQI